MNTINTERETGIDPHVKHSLIIYFIHSSHAHFTAPTERSKFLEHPRGLSKRKPITSAGLSN